MNIVYTNHFLRSFKKLSLQQKKSVTKALTLFQENPTNAKLRNHKLSGTLSDIRSLYAEYNLRIIYQETDGGLTALFLDLGTHDRIY